MRRIIVIGCPGAGKSTFSRKLSVKTGLQVHYLDMVWHKPDRTTISRDVFIRRLEKIMHEREWIIDGNYLHTLRLRLDNCDTAFFFDLPPDVCLAGAEHRLGKSRADMPWIDYEIAPEFRQCIIDFPARQALAIRKLLSEYRDKVNVIVFHSREDADKYLEQL